MKLEFLLRPYESGYVTDDEVREGLKGNSHVEAILQLVKQYHSVRDNNHLIAKQRDEHLHKAKGLLSGLQKSQSTLASIKEAVRLLMEAA